MYPPASIFEQIVSKPRLDSYKGYWKVSSEAAVGLCMWNAEVCAELSKLLSYLEIALRNSIHREMSLHATNRSSSSSFWWDAQWPRLKPKTKDDITKVRAKSPVVALSPDEIVSRLSFGFWPNVLTWIAKQFPTAMWNVFPMHPLSLRGAAPNWWNTAARQEAIQDFFEFNEARNRIAHHEPLWKFPPVVDTSPVKPVVRVPGSNDEASTIKRFLRLLDLYDRAIFSISPTLQSHLASSSWRMRLDFLLSRRGLDRYLSGAHVADQHVIDTLSLHREFAVLIQRNRPVHLQDHGGRGLFIPA